MKEKNHLQLFVHLKKRFENISPARAVIYFARQMCSHRSFNDDQSHQIELGFQGECAMSVQSYIL